MRILPFSEAIQRAIQKFHKLISLYGWRLARPIDYKVSLNFLATSTLSLLASQHHHYDVTSLISLKTITGVIFEAACFFLARKLSKTLYFDESTDFVSKFFRDFAWPKHRTEAS